VPAGLWITGQGVLQRGPRPLDPGGHRPPYNCLLVLIAKQLLSFC